MAERGGRGPTLAVLRALHEWRTTRSAHRELGHGVATRLDVDGHHDDEVRAAQRMTPRRAEHFLLGRAALRRALVDADLPVPAGPIPPVGGAAPRLPGVTASISHSGGIAVALAGSAQRFAAIGVDLEFAALPPAAAHLVLTEPERAWLAEAGPDLELRLLTAFSAKESVLKALDIIAAVPILRAIALIPSGNGFVAWPTGRPDLRLSVFAQPIGPGVLTWTRLPHRP